VPQTEQHSEETKSEAVPAESVPAEAIQPSEDSLPSTVLRRIESKFPRGLVIRLVAYLFVGHLFAFFVYLLFVLGAQRQ